MHQIEALQAEADKPRRKEAEGVIALIREAIEHYGITAADLGLDSGGAGRKPSARKKAAAAAAVKYRDEAGRTESRPARRPQGAAPRPRRHPEVRPRAVPAASARPPRRTG